MNKEQLQDTLEQLRAEVNALDKDNDPVKARINSLIVDLEWQLQNLDDAGHRATMRERLDQLIGQVETRHPVITAMLERIAANLANIGI